MTTTYFAGAFAPFRSREGRVLAVVTPPGRAARARQPYHGQGAGGLAITSSKRAFTRLIFREKDGSRRGLFCTAVRYLELSEEGWLVWLMSV